MEIRRFAAVLLAAAFAWTAPANAQTFPQKTVKIIVPYAAGGGTDIVARIVAQKLQEKWGQPTIVENRAGAGGNIGADAVFTSSPDGYTLLFTAQGPLVVNKSLYDKLSYEPEKFEPVSLVMVAYSALLASPKVEPRTVQDLIAYAKANPGKLNYASQGIGTAAHLIAELFGAMAKVKITHVPYKGSGPALNDLVAGHVDIMFGELAAAMPHIESGKLRALAVSGDKRVAKLPSVPTVNEVLPGFVVTSWWGLVAPPKTPPEIVNRISTAVGEIMRDPDVVAKLDGMSMVSTGSTPSDFAKFIGEEAKRWGDVIKTSGASAR